MSTTLPSRMLRLARTVVLVAVSTLFLVVTLLVSAIDKPSLVDLVVHAFFWACGALGALGLVGALVTANGKWLWWIPVAATVAAVAMLIALSRFNWGM